MTFKMKMQGTFYPADEIARSDRKRPKEYDELGQPVEAPYMENPQFMEQNRVMEKIQSLQSRIAKARENPKNTGIVQQYEKLLDNYSETFNESFTKSMEKREKERLARDPSAKKSIPKGVVYESDPFLEKIPDPLVEANREADMWQRKLDQTKLTSQTSSEESDD